MNADTNLWMRKREILTLIGAGQEFFRTQIQPELAAEHARRRSSRGKPWEFFGPGVIKILLRRFADSNDAQILAGAPSPELERLRKAKADLAELLVREKCGELCSVPHTRAVLGRWASLIRQMGDSIGRTYGAEASATVTETLRQCQQLIRTEFPATGTEDGTEDD